MWHWLQNSFSTFNLQMGLLVASGVLAVCLLVLALTRWGQSRPIWKCVILSFAAHILLVVYAYGTYLIFEQPDPGLAGRDNVRVNLIASNEDLVSNSASVQAVPDWSSMPNPEQLPPILETLERPEIDSEVVIERILPLQNTAPELDSRWELPVSNEVVLVPAETEPDLLESKALPRPELKLDSPEMPFARRPQTENSVAELPQLSSEEDLPRLKPDNDFRPESVQPDLKELTLPGLGPGLIDPSSQFSSTDNQLPPPRLTDHNAFQPLAQEISDSRFKRVSASRAADGKAMPEVYSLRHAVDRQQIMLQRGGSPETEAAVQAGLRWLVQSQEADGRWDADRWGAGTEKKVLGHDRKGAGAEADTGITGLAVLALLASGSSHLEGPYRNSIQKAIDFLMLKQSPNGDLAGDSRLFAHTYCHSMALLALSETLAVTGDARLIHAVQKGVDFSVRAQNKNDGGWRYQPGDSGDMSQHGWQVLAMQSAKMGGIHVPPHVFDGMKAFVDQCASGSYGGLSSYRPRNAVSTSMTAEALVCRFILQEELSVNTISEAARRVSTERPTALQINLYYWYYGTLAMYQVGGNEWDQWNAELKKALLGTQIQSGAEAGSWAPDCLWGGYGGRVYSTALAALNLQIYYRYSPNLRQAAVISEPSETLRR